MKYYLFSPLIGEDGMQVVRKCSVTDWVETENGPFPYWSDEVDIKEYPILTIQTSEEDPFGEIREVFEKYKDADYQSSADRDKETWKAISATMKRLERRKV